MRYDSVIRRIQGAQDKYEASVRTILQDALKMDAATEQAILSHRKPRGPYKKKSKAGRKPMSAKMRKEISQRMKAFHAAKKAGKK